MTNRLPLAGVTVLDCSRVFAGPTPPCCSPTSGPRSGSSSRPPATRRGAGARRSGATRRRAERLLRGGQPQQAQHRGRPEDRCRARDPRPAGRAGRPAHPQLPALGGRPPGAWRPAGSASGIPAWWCPWCADSRAAARRRSDRPTTSWPRPGAGTWPSPASRTAGRSRSGWAAGPAGRAGGGGAALAGLAARERGRGPPAGIGQPGRGRRRQAGQRARLSPGHG